MIAGRPVAARAIFTAFSTASAPVLKKIAFLSPAIGATSHRRSASRRYDSYMTTWKEVWVVRSSCSFTASRTRGWLWPTFITPIPPTKSMYRRPLTSQSSEPLARSAVSGWAVLIPRGTYLERRSARSVSVDRRPTLTRPFKQIRSGTCGGCREGGRADLARPAGRDRPAGRRDHQPELQGGRGRGHLRAPDGRREDGTARHRPDL